MGLACPEARILSRLRRLLTPATIAGNETKGNGHMRFSGLTPLLAPRSVAVLGASNDAARIGGRPIAYMLKSGFKGALYPVNPNRAEVQGLRAYASVADLPETPDVAIVAVPASIAVQALDDLG
ncbi:MAG: CoA-binding protein, partial [Acetobacteraceae bacterium]